MSETIRREVTIGKNGTINLPPLDLPEGTRADLILIVHPKESTKPIRSLTDMIGAGRGIYGTREEIDAYIRAERDSWD